MPKPNPNRNPNREHRYLKRCRAAPSALLEGDFGRVSAPKLASYTVG